MDVKDTIRELDSLYEHHKDDIYSPFEVRWADVARYASNKLRMLYEENCQLNRMLTDIQASNKLRDSRELDTAFAMERTV